MHPKYLEVNPVQLATTTYTSHYRGAANLSYLWTAAGPYVYCKEQRTGVTFLRSAEPIGVDSWTRIQLPPGVEIKQTEGFGGGFYSDTRAVDRDNPKEVYCVVTYRPELRPKGGAAYPPATGWYLPLPPDLEAGDYIASLLDPFWAAPPGGNDGGPTGQIFSDNPGGSYPPVTFSGAESAPRSLSPQIAVCQSVNKSGVLIFATDTSGILWCLTNSNTPYWAPISTTATAEPLPLFPWTGSQPNLDPTQPIVAARVSQLNYPVVIGKLADGSGLAVFYANDTDPLDPNWDMTDRDQPGFQWWVVSTIVAALPTQRVDQWTHAPGNSMAAVTIPGGSGGGEFPVPYPDVIALFVDMSDSVYMITVAVGQEFATNLPQPFFPATITYTGFDISIEQQGTSAIATPNWTAIGSPSSQNLSNASPFLGTIEGIPEQWEIDYKPGYALAASIGSAISLYVRCRAGDGTLTVFLVTIDSVGNVIGWRNLSRNDADFPSNFDLPNQPDAQGHPKSEALADITVGQFFAVDNVSGTAAAVTGGDDLLAVQVSLLVPTVIKEDPGTERPEIKPVRYSTIGEVLIKPYAASALNVPVSWGLQDLIV
jgi:hypothetical protein